MAGFRIEHPSESRGEMIVPWACGLVVAAIAGVWQFTHWIPAEHETAAMAAAGAGVLLGALAFLAGRRGAVSGVASGAKLVWCVPRSTQPAGEIDLKDIAAVRIDTGDRVFLIIPHVGKPIPVAEQCVQDLWSMASELASKQPQIEIYVDGNRVAAPRDC
jgi:hypothetical protein